MPGQDPMPDRVDATVKWMEHAALQADPDPVASQPRPDQVGAIHDPVLTAGQPGDHEIHGTRGTFGSCEELNVPRVGHTPRIAGWALRLGAAV